MSLEAALDEERREVIALLEGRPLGRRVSNSNNISPSEVIPVRSMLDWDTPPPENSSNVLPTASASLRTLSVSPQSATAVLVSADSNLDKYRFEMIPSVPANPLPKRASQGGSSLAIPGFGPRRNSSSTQPRTAPPLSPLVNPIGMKRNPLTPASTSFRRTSSPRRPGLNTNTNSFNLMARPGQYTAESGEVVNMSQAYARLSNTALAKTGSLASIMRRGYDHDTGTSVAPDGTTRLERDPSFEDGDDENGDDDDDDDDNSDDSSSDSEDDDDERGRAKIRQVQSLLDEFDSDAETNNLALSRGKSGKNGRDRSSSQASQSSQSSQNSLPQGVQLQKYRSLFDDEIGTETLASNTTHNTGKKRARKKSPFFETSYVSGGGDVADSDEPMDSDTEADLTDIRTAHTMSMQFSPIISTPGSPRCVHQIIRGDYGLMQQQVAHGQRRQRMYIVATDLSDEAKYALEWAIGTVVRDGDTLLAVYAMDEPGGGNEETGARFVYDLLSVMKSMGGLDWREGRSSRQQSAPTSRAGSVGTPAKSGSRSRSGSILGRASRAFGSGSAPTSPRPSPLSRTVSSSNRTKSMSERRRSSSLTDDMEASSMRGKSDGSTSSSLNQTPTSTLSPDSPLTQIPFLELPDNLSLDLAYEAGSTAASPVSVNAIPRGGVDTNISPREKTNSSQQGDALTPPRPNERITFADARFSHHGHPDFTLLDEEDRERHKLPENFDSMSRLEQERWKATAEISRRCSKLLRRTKLQVRVVIEVFHCKSPKRMLTDVIDYLEPTLVILGSRGRSSLKGVLLGSFSNYLVTKSSIPVMVVRTRLRKQGKKGSRAGSNSNGLQTRHRNLVGPVGRLVDAKID